jgi:hypothetical protein
MATGTLERRVALLERGGLDACPVCRDDPPLSVLRSPTDEPRRCPGCGGSCVVRIVRDRGQG